MNEWIRVFAQGFNDILTSGFDLYGGKGHILFTGNVETDDKQYEFKDEFRYSKVDPLTGERVSESINVDDDSYYRLTAKNMSVLDIVAADPDLLATKKDQTAGADEYDNVTELINMVTDKDAASFRGAPTADFLVCILSDVALNANSANTFYNTYTNVGKSIDNQRLSISGVDKDEEAVNLVKFQNAYNLASRMIQTLTEIYDRLILQTGV
jgi:flagellar hook-associated protein 1 FlgK